MSEEATHTVATPVDGSAKVLRTTRGTCPVCVEEVDARLVISGGRVLLEKICPDHGTNRMVLSESTSYFADLVRFYHEVLPESLPQRDFILRLTARCNMHCPICLASSDEYEERDLSLDEIRDFLESSDRRLKLDLMGAEPTVRSDLEEIVHLASERGHITALHTNGIKIAEGERLDRLVQAGLDEVHLQFDGFEDEHDLVLRGRPMSDVRHKVLEQLRRQEVATDLVVTVLRDCNEDQMAPVLEYAARNDFVKEVFYLGCRRLGRATEAFAQQSVAPDELIDDLENATDGRINREDVRRFQKLYFSLLAAFRVRKCFYIHHYMVIRTADGYLPVADMIDLPFLERRLERLPGLLRRGRPLAAAYLFAQAAVAILRRRGFPLLIDGAKLTLMLLFGFDLSKVRRRTVLIGFISACDPWMHDVQVSANCGKGEVATDVGVHAAGADANVARERLHLTLERNHGRGSGADTS